MLGKLKAGVVGENASGNQVVEVPQHFCRVQDGFVLADVNVVGAQEQPVATQDGHAGLHRNPGASAQLLKDHGMRVFQQRLKVGIFAATFLRPQVLFEICLRESECHKMKVSWSMPVAVRETVLKTRKRNNTPPDPKSLRFQRE